jgi:hypothetical protein
LRLRRGCGSANGHSRVRSSSSVSDDRELSCSSCSAGRRGGGAGRTTRRHGLCSCSGGCSCRTGIARASCSGGRYGSEEPGGGGTASLPLRRESTSDLSRRRPQ